MIDSIRDIKLSTATTTVLVFVLGQTFAIVLEFIRGLVTRRNDRLARRADRQYELLRRLQEQIAANVERCSDIAFRARMGNPLADERTGRTGPSVIFTILMDVDWSKIEVESQLITDKTLRGLAKGILDTSTSMRMKATSVALSPPGLNLDDEIKKIYDQSRELAKQNKVFVERSGAYLRVND